MKASDKSALLFILGCIPARVALAYVAKTHTEWLRPLAAVALAIGLGFLFIYFTDARKSGAETFGQPIWWNDLRPLHGALYLAFATAAMAGRKDAWVILTIDVMVGAAAFVHHHYIAPSTKS